MSYSPLDTPQNKPLYNGERYPPIPLPEPAQSSAQLKPMDNTNAASGAMNSAIFLEAGSAVAHNASGFVVAGAGAQDNGLEVKNIMFNDQTIRKAFIRKVYLILLTQLLFTCGMISIFMFHEPTKLFVQHNPGVVIVAVCVNIVVMFSMACCETARRTYPVNFVCLGLFTFTMSMLLGAVASKMDVDIVLMAVGITSLLVVALSIFAIQTKYDFTAMGGAIIVVVICLLVLAFAGAFLDRAFGNTAISCLGAMLASFMLIYDTQLMIGGNHKYQFNPEDYIFAALTLYVDVVRIFLYILRLFKR